MDVRTVFRNLTTNVYMENIDYASQKFSFKTVFYTTPFIYRCCSCAFEFEFLEFISETCEINEELYKKIIQSIVDGKCPHVDNVPEEHTAETSVCGLHIAAGVGTERATIENLDHHHSRGEGLFNLTHSYASVIKKQFDKSLEIYNACYVTWYPVIELINEVPYVRKVNNSLYRYKVAEKFPFEFYIEHEDNAKLELFLKSPRDLPGLSQALEYTMKHNLEHLQDSVLKYIKDNASFEQNSDYFTNSLIRCLHAAMMYDQPKILDMLMRYVPLNEVKDAFKCDLWFVLDREACRKVLLRHGCLKTKPLQLKKQTTHLFSVLEQFYNTFKQEIIDVIKKLIQNSRRKLDNQLTTFVMMNTHKPNLVKVAFDLGADINSISTGKTPLMYLLRKHRNLDNIYTDFRKTMELFINENPDVNLHKNAVNIALDIDGRKRLRTDMVGDYVADTQLRGWYGHTMDDRAALNFMCPLLMESGFPVANDILDRAKDKQLQQAEYQYIQTFFDRPQTLKVLCRNTLRRHYRGRKIHKLVEIALCPQTVKDFILLKHILLTLY